MKIKTVFFFFILLCLSHKIFSTAKISFSLEPNTILNFSQHDEIFYSSIGKEKPVSLLEWKSKPLWSIGIDATIAIKNLSLKTGFSYAIPIRCGEMHDSDFETFSGMKYCYSINELYSKSNFNTLLELDYKIVLTSFFSISPIISLQYNYDNFQAKNGYGWYGMETASHPLVEWDDSRAKYYAKGKLNGVDFYRHSFFTFCGLGCDFNISRFIIGFDILMSPYTYFQTMDHHLSKSGGYHVLQKQSSSFTHYTLGGSISYKINEQFSPQIEINYISGSTIKGKLYSDIYSGQMELTDQKSGANLKSLSIKAGLFIKII